MVAAITGSSRADGRDPRRLGAGAIRARAVPVGIGAAPARTGGRPLSTAEAKRPAAGTQS